MRSLPNHLYQCHQVQAMDKAAIRSGADSGFELMMRAGQGAFTVLLQKWPDTKVVSVFCGSGNNGGDGYIVAALAIQAGLDVRVFSLAEPAILRGDALSAYQLALEHGVQVERYDNASTIEGVVVDALLGIGLNGEVREPYSQLIYDINASMLPVLSIDIPSGICGDTGQVLGVAVKAEVTITFIAVKQGLLTADACDHVGELVYEDLGVDKSVFDTQRASCQHLQYVPPLLPARNKNSHKGLFGHVLVIGGDRGYGGAAIMAAESALLCGAGIVSLATRTEHISAALVRRPELIVHQVTSATDLEPLIEKANILVLGPGLGLSDWSLELFQLSIKTTLPIVIDADGLNLLAQQFDNLTTRENWVLTPHPGEAARLLSSSAKQTNTAEIQTNRFAAAQALQQKYGGVVALKGAGTLIAEQSSLHLCSAGNPAMSTPGMGDVLSGVIGGLLASGITPAEACKMAVWAHASAADLSAKTRGRHLLATEIYSHLRQLL